MPNEPDRVAALVERCVAAAERGDGAAVQEIVRDHPAEAAVVRARLLGLARAGLLADDVLRWLDGLPSFGPYEVLERIGSGGMGAVWRARQREPVEREIALKVIRVGVGADSRELLARFETERRTLALMSHANIARLYDAGVTPEGRPYLAMELVDGPPITALADAGKLTLRRRLELLLPVLDAVHHAHQRGVIHRDLKPSNVLVEEKDGELVPKVIDFGVAKALDESGLPAATSFTLDGRFVGTPAYMSPEQAAGTSGDVDVRSDVYALGVLLYELTTGELPFDRERLESAGLRELADLLLEHDTPAPSARVGRLAAIGEIAAARQTTPSGLQRALRGEVDWIVLRALEKERERRYESVRELADDIRRLLRGEPVRAGPRSFGYRVRKFVRRHRAGVSAAVVGAAALVTALAVSLSSAVATEAARVRAERNLAAAMRAIDEMLAEVGARHLEHVPHMAPVRRQLLERALALYDELIGLSDPDDRVTVLDTRLQKVAVLELLGDYATGESELDALLAELGEPTGHPLRRCKAVATRRLANVYARTGRITAARLAYGRALATLDALLSDDAADRELATERANTLNNLGTVIGRGDPATASATMSEAVAEFRRLDAERADPELTAKAATTQVFAASLLWDAGEHDRALAELDAARTAAQELVAVHERRVDARRAVGLAEENLGLCHLRSGELDFAEPRFAAAADTFRALVADYPAVPEFRRSIGRCLNNLAAVHGQRGDDERAAEILEETVSHSEALARLHPDALPVRLGLLSALLNLVTAEINRSEDTITERGGRAIERALELSENLHADVPSDPHVAILRARALRHAASAAVLGDAVDFGDALRRLEQAGAVLEAARSPGSDTLLAPEHLAVRALRAELVLRGATGSDERRAAESAMRTVIADAVADHPSEREVQVTAAGARLGAARELLRAGDRERALAWLQRADGFVVGDVAAVIVPACHAAARGAELARDDASLGAAARERERDAWAATLAALLDRAAAVGVDTGELMRSPAFAVLRSHPLLARHTTGR